MIRLRTIVDHELAAAAEKTLHAAREGLDAAFDFYGGTNRDHLGRVKLALEGIALACETVADAARQYVRAIEAVQDQRER